MLVSSDSCKSLWWILNLQLYKVPAVPSRCQISCTVLTCEPVKLMTTSLWSETGVLAVIGIQQCT